VDSSGNLYFADGTSHQVLKETPQPDGTYVESVLSSTSFQNPTGVAVDASNNVYVADASAHALFKETPSGTGYTESVVSSTYTPISVAVDSGGNVYLCDGSMSLHRVTLTAGVYQDAPGVFFGQHEAWSVAVDGSGNLYITDPANGVYKETPSGGSYSDALVSSAFGYPANVAVDTQGNLYVADASFSQLPVETFSGGIYSQSVIPANGLNAPQGVAVDASGNVYIADTNNSRIVKFTPSAKMGQVNLGSTSGAVSMIFEFGGVGGSFASTAFLTQGTPGLDFADAGTGNCLPGNSYDGGNNCTVDVRMTPAAPGSRMGAVELLDGSGNVLATGYASGTGVAPLATFSPFTSSVVVDGTTNGFYYPVGISVDTAGNIFVADTWNYRLVKETLSAGTYTASTIFTGAGRVYGGRVDGAGNVYVSDCSTYQILKLPWNGSSYDAPIDVADWNSTDVVWCPTDIAADTQGNLFVTDYYQTYIYKIPLTDGAYGAPIPIGNGFNKPYAIAIDLQNNLFVSDWGNDRVVEVPWTGSNYGPQVVLASGTGSPVGLALDNRGNVYVANEDNNTASVIPKAGNGFGPVTTLSSNYLDAPQGLGLDSRGNIFLVNYNGGNVVKLAVSAPPSLTFATTVMGATSSDSPQTVSIINIGNAPLTFIIPRAGTNPTISADFQLNSNGGSACPLTDSGASTAATLAEGASCDFVVSFVPTEAGTIAGGLAIWDDSLNAAAGVTQSVALNGVATAIATTSTLSISPNPPTAGQATTFTAIIAPSPTGMPFGTVDFYNGSTLLGTGSVNASGVATFTSISLTAGTMSMTAVYSGNSGFAVSTSSVQSVTVNPAPTSTATTLSISPSPTHAGQATTFTATVSPVPTGGTVTFYFGEGGLLGTATVNGSGIATLTTSSLTAGTWPIMAQYSGNSGFASSHSSPQNLTVNQALTTTTTALSISPNPTMSGQATMFTATVSPVPTGTPLGMVGFFNGTTLLGTGTVNSSGVATFTTSSLLSGYVNAKAVYSGNAGYATSTSTTTILPVYQAPTTTTTVISISPNPANIGQTISFTATISPNPMSAGTVSFYNGSTLLGTASVGTACVVNDAIAVPKVNVQKASARFQVSTVSPSPCGVAIFTTSSLAAGTYNVTAVYSGNNQFATSTSSVQSLTVNTGTGTTPSASTTTLTAPPAMEGMPLTLTATIAPTPTGSSLGTVSFYNGSTLLGTASVNASGIATFTTSDLHMGTYALTASYSGGTTLLASTSAALSLTVDAGYKVTAPSVPVPVEQGGTVDVNVTVPPLGAAFNRPVTLSATGLPPGATAMFTPPVVTPGTTGAPVVMTINLGTIRAALPKGHGRLPLAPFGLTFAVLGVVMQLKRFSKKTIRVAAFSFSIVFAVMLAGCGGGFSGGSKVQPGSYVVTITGTSGTLQASTTVTVVIK
jgi:sugar lactone lactonase YvrE